MGYHQDPRTGEWIIDDAPEFPSGLIGGQDNSASTAPPIAPPYEPPPPAPPPPEAGPPADPNAIPTQPGYDFEPSPVYLPGQDPSDPSYSVPLTPQEQQQLADQVLTGNLSVDGVPSGANPAEGIGEGRPITAEQGAIPGIDDTPGSQPAPPDLGPLPPPVGSPDQLAGASPLQLGEPNLPSPTAAGAEKPLSLQMPDLAAPMVAPPANLATPGEGPGVPTPDVTAEAPTPGAATPGAPEASTTPSATPPAPGPVGPIVPAGDAKGLTEQQIAERQKQQVLEEKDAKIKQDHLNDIANIREKAKTDADAIVQRHEAELQSAWQKQKEDQDKYRAMGEKDAWGDNATRNKILAGIAILLGGRKAAYFMIGAANGLEEKKKTELALQAKVMEQNGKTFDQIREHQALEMADFNTRKAAGLDAAVARAEAEMQAQGIPLTQINANQDILKLKAEGLKAEEKAKDLLLKEQEQKAKDELARRKTESEIALNEARTAHMGKGGRVGKGGGGAGSASGGTAGLTPDEISAKMSPAEALAKRIQDGVVDPDTGTRRELTQPEKIHAANELRIPVTGTPSETTLKTINEGSVFNANQEIKEKRGGIQGDRLISQESKAWGAQNQLPAIAKKQQELSAVIDEINNAPHNPLQQALAVEKAVSSARGGAASRQALDLALHHLGGKWDSIGAMVQGARDGELDSKQMDNFIGFMNNQYGTAQKEGKDKYDAFNKYVDSIQDPAKKKTLLDERSRLFSGMAGFGGTAPEASTRRPGAGEQTAPGAPAKAPAASQDVIPIRTNSDRALLAKARMTKPSDPNYDSAQMWLRAHGQ
jgi:hypothetical protein